MNEYGLDSQSRFSDITDNDLDSLVDEIVVRLPTCGVQYLVCSEPKKLECGSHFIDKIF